MKVLLVGGSGRVGSFITPYLRERHDLRVFDLRPPRHAGIDYVEGSITDPAAVARALDGCDSFVNLVMKGPQGSTRPDQSIELIVDNYGVNTLGLHLLLYTAQGLGIKRGVHTSTVSVHFRQRERFHSEEGVPLDSPTVYGLTKGFGELICEYFARWFDMNLIALRITGPRERDAWIAERKNPTAFEAGRRIYVTDEEDLATAYLAALERVQIGHGRFDAVFLADDENEEHYNLSKARRLLGWEPRSQRYLAGGEPAAESPIDWRVDE